MLTIDNPRFAWHLTHQWSSCRTWLLFVLGWGLVAPFTCGIMLNAAGVDPAFSDANWVSLGSLHAPNSFPSAAALDATGNLYVGGQPAAYVARAILSPIAWRSIVAGVPQPNANTLVYSGLPNAPYVTLYSTNLTAGQWDPLLTNTTAADGYGTVLDAAATNAQRFYRLRTPD